MTSKIRNMKLQRRNRLKWSYFSKLIYLTNFDDRLILILLFSLLILFTQMERKIIKNDLLSHKKFLITLIKIFNEIQQELKKIPNFDSRNVI